MDNTTDQVAPTAGQVWKRMPEEKRRLAADAFWREKEGVEQQFEAMALLAQHHKFRPVFVQRMPIDKRTRYLANYKTMPDALAARLLVSYHLAHQRPMLGALLDALGIAHEEGLITTDPDAPRDQASAPFLDGVRRFLHEHLGLDVAVDSIVGATCLYDLTPTTDFVIDHLPGHPAVLVATGGSGHAFKFGPVLGRVVMDRLDGGAGPWLPVFSWERATGGGRAGAGEDG